MSGASIRRVALPSFVFVLALIVLVSCSSSATPDIAVDWTSCDGGFECQELEVPLDYADPDGPTITVALLRKPASNQAERIGVLLVNPGGPGGSGKNLAKYLSFQLDYEITKRFDIIGFDPRGTGDSSPLECNDTLGTIYSVNPAPRTEEDKTELFETSQTFVEDCAEKYGNVLEHLGTRNVAQDMDYVRRALGEDKLNYLGYSYGTSIGQVYAELFGENIRAMVLDGVVKLGQPGIDAAIAQGEGFEQSLENAFDACLADPDCPIREDPDAAFERVLGSLGEGSMEASHTGGRQLTSGMFQIGVAQALYSEFMWADLWDGLARADQATNWPPGDPGEADGAKLLGLADQYLHWIGPGKYAHGSEIYFAVSCLDWDWPSSPEDFLTAGREAAKTAPRMGEAIVTDYIRCAYWPTPPQPLTPPEVTDAPPIVVVSTTDDAATPYVNGVELVDLLPGAVLITKEGSDHTSFGDGDRCVDDPIIDYLIDLETPPADVDCPTA